MKPGGKSVLSTYPYLFPDTTHILKVGLNDPFDAAAVIWRLALRVDEDQQAVVNRANADGGNQVVLYSGVVLLQHMAHLAYHLVHSLVQQI